MSCKLRIEMQYKIVRLIWGKKADTRLEWVCFQTSGFPYSRTSSQINNEAD